MTGCSINVLSYLWRLDHRMPYGGTSSHLTIPEENPPRSRVQGSFPGQETWSAMLESWRCLRSVQSLCRLEFSRVADAPGPKAGHVGMGKVNRSRLPCGEMYVIDVSNVIFVPGDCNCVTLVLGGRTLES